MKKPTHKVFLCSREIYFNKYLIRHISPTGTNRFKKIELTDNIDEADYLFIIGGDIQKRIQDKFPKERTCVLRQEHPSSPKWGRRMAKDGLEKTGCAFRSPVFFHCETINRDYSFLKKAKPKKKINKCACYISSKKTLKQHKNRYNWLLKYVDLYPNDLDIYSADNRVRKDFEKCFKEIKKEKSRITPVKRKIHKNRLYEGFKYENISKYNFFLALDNDMDLRDWCNDHLFDPILCYCYTLYCGCPNISDYLDMKSIFQFRTDDEESFRKVHEVLNSVTMDSSILRSIEKNREIILDDLNFFNLINREVEKRER